MEDGQQPDEMVQKSADVSMGDDARGEDAAEDLDLQSKEGSPNISSSSDLVSGTPQKHNSRRQSFITLEKYSEGKPASPGIVSTFTGPLIKTTSSQERCNINDSQVSQTPTDPNCQDSLSTNIGKVHSQSPENNDFECIRRPKESLKCEPVRLADKMPTKATEDDDIIPDTQTEVEEKGDKMDLTLKELKPLSQEEEEPQQTLDCSQSSDTQASSGEPRRSGRYKVRPLLSGEDAEEQAEKSMQIKRRRSGEEPKSVSPKSSLLQSRPNTRRSHASEEENGKSRLRIRTQRDQSESSQTNSQGRARKKIKLFNSSQEFLDKPEPKRRSTRESSQSDSQSNTPCDDESLSQGRRRRSKVSVETKEEGEMKKKVLTSSQESSQNVEQTKKDDDEPMKDSQIITVPLQTNGKSQELECLEQTEKDGAISQKDSQMITCSSHIGGQSQQFDCTENTKKEEDSQIVTLSPNINHSLDRTSPINKLTVELGVSDTHKNIEDTDENLSTEDSQASISSSSDSQSLRRSRRSNTLSKASESEKGENKRRNSRSNSKVVTQVEGRTRSCNGQEVHSKLSPLSTPENSQSVNVAGSTEVSQGRGRYSRRKSSQASAANLESSECESSEPKESLPMPKKRGRKPRASLQSPLTLTSKEPETNNDVVNECDVHQKADAQSIEHTHLDETTLDDSRTTPNFQDSESLNIEEQHKDSQTEVDAVDLETKPFGVSPQKEEQREKGSKIIDTASQESETAEKLEVVQEKLPCSSFLLSGKDTLSPVVDATERLQSLEENPKGISESGSSGVEKQNGSDHRECPLSPVENLDEVSDGAFFGDNPVQCSNATDGSPREQEQSASTEEGIPPNQHTTDYITPLQDSDKDGETQTQKCQEDEEAKTTNTEKNLDPLPDADGASVLPESNRKDVVQGSPAKLKDLDSLMGPDFSQSPSSRTRGTWSPSASPSSSILKKGQKRALDDETPSPLVKVSEEAAADFILYFF